MTASNPEDLPSLETTLGHSFASAALLQEALTHRSFGTPHNERLEFLGDGALNFVIAAELWRRHPDLREGELSRLRASLVREESLAEIALELGLGVHLRLGDGEARSGGAARPSILADALEALLGAVYMDGGFEALHTVVRHLYRDRLDAPTPKGLAKDPKTALQELIQGRRLALPAYELEASHGAAHSQTFVVACVIPALGVRTSGEGTSRRLAEQRAAQAALDQLATTNPSASQ
jgi:ribonuclease III